MTSPALSPPFDTEIKTVKDINGNQVKVQGMGVNCTINYTQTTIDDGAEFYVAFYFDNNDSYSIGYWTQTPNTPVTTQEGVLDKYFGRNVRKNNFYSRLERQHCMYFSKVCIMGPNTNDAD